MTLLQSIEHALAVFASAMWGMPLLMLLVGGGLYLLISSRLRPYRYLAHSVDLLRGRFDDSHDPGQVPHSQALSTALAGTLGLGNIAGVAIAISVGGPGAVFWMWVTALVGVATKFYTGSLAVMYRGLDSRGELQGGPMYVIREALGRHWQPLALLFCVAGMFGALPVFQANQLTQLLRDSFAVPAGWIRAEQAATFDLALGAVMAVMVGVVIVGRIERIGKVAVRLVPGMVLFYLAVTLLILLEFWPRIPAMLWLILSDAFTGHAAAGGALWAVIQVGISRGAFSNEAGIGTESMAHGAAKTQEPIREGLVAMVGPVVDTLIVCTCTALVILLTGVWQDSVGIQGVTLTAMAFEQVFPRWGSLFLLALVIPLAFSTMFAGWYYGSKCLGFLAGAERQFLYTPVFIGLIVIGAIVSLDAVNNLIIGMYAVMAIPTMTSTLALAPRVNAAAQDYFARIGKR